MLGLKLKKKTAVIVVKKVLFGCMQKKINNVLFAGRRPTLYTPDDHNMVNNFIVLN